MADITNFLQESIRAACDTFESLQELAQPVTQTVDAMAECLCAGRKLLVCGNGGSAADGADFSAEFGCRFVTDRRPYPALNLAQGGSLMSAIGNDYGYDEVFARQVAGLGQKGDVLVAITTSGNSKNILRALEEGKFTWPNDRGIARSERRTGERNGGNRAPRATVRRRREFRRRTNSCSTSFVAWWTRVCRGRDDRHPLFDEQISNRFVQPFEVDRLGQMLGETGGARLADVVFHSEPA